MCERRRIPIMAYSPLDKDVSALGELEAIARATAQTRASRLAWCSSRRLMGSRSCSEGMCARTKARWRCVWMRATSRSWIAPFRRRQKKPWST